MCRCPAPTPICTVTVALETGIVPMREPTTEVTVDTPGGPVKAVAKCRDGKCLSVEFGNVPAFVDKLDATIEVEGVRRRSPLDIAYGGMFYAHRRCDQAGLCDRAGRGARAGGAGRENARWRRASSLTVVHPENPGISGVSIVQLNRPFEGVGQTTRNTCIVAPGRSDRSPTGTGTCARMAVLHARGQMKVGDHMIHESIIGSRFKGTHRGRDQDRRPAGHPAAHRRAEPGSPASTPIASMRAIPIRRAMWSRTAGA